MAYRRRYFPALTITTISYAEKSVTTDKLADKAVTSPKVAPDTIDSEHVIDESLKSGDIKDGEIKSSDIAPGAITTSKIASRAVTSDKLEEAIAGVSRPLTPGVDTPEIQDGKVTLAKLAPDSVDASKIKPGAVGPTELAVDAVEESRVKDGAISRDKIAGGAIDSTKLGVGACDASAILNGSVGHPELATDSVRTDKVKDLNITGAKIAPNTILASTIKADEDLASRMPDKSILPAKIHISALSLAKDKEMNRFFDDFMGNALSPAWVQAGAPGYTILPDTNSSFNLKTGAVSGNDCRLDWGGELGAGPTNLVFPGLVVGIRAREGNTYLTTFIGLWKDVNNYIAFYADSVGAGVPTWKARCIKAGNLTEIDTGVSVGPFQMLELLYDSPTSVYFDIDGVQVAHITTGASIPAVDVEPRLEVITKTDAFRSFRPDFVSLLQTRETP